MAKELGNNKEEMSNLIEVTIEGGGLLKLPEPREYEKYDGTTGMCEYIRVVYLAGSYQWVVVPASRTSVLSWTVLGYRSKITSDPHAQLSDISGTERALADAGYRMKAIT